jgi:hypothetical protein
MKNYTRIVKKMFNELGYNFIKVRKGEVMCADMENQVIYLDDEWFRLDTYETKQDTKAVKKLYKTYGWKISVSMGMFAILHELGHCLTAPTYSDLDKEHNAYIHKQNKINTKILDNYNVMRKYRKIRLERDADLTAYAIYKKNKKLIAYYDKMLKEIITGS